MLNPDSLSSGSYPDLRQRILRHLRSGRIDDRVLEVLQKAYEEALAIEDLVLSRVERKRLLTDVLKSELEELSQRLDDGLISD